MKQTWNWVGVSMLGLAVVACESPEAPNEAASAPAESEARTWFDAGDLSGWSAVLVDPEVGKEDVWSVEDGVLVCKGEPLGYLHTDEDFTDFHLSLEWRWAPGTEPGNCGVLMRIASAPEPGEPVSFLPKCVEAQLQHGNAGDLYAFFGGSLEGDPERFKVIESEKIGTFNALPKMKAMEKPPGEWNHYDIKVTGPDITVKINGELVNEGTGLDMLAGPIGLQSEGGEIHFRKLRLTEL
jgi:hypothetical protein